MNQGKVKTIKKFNDFFLFPYFAGVFILLTIEEGPR